MDLKQLRYFARVAELGSFTRAAAELRIAQSALSYQVAELEEELGVLLLNRHSRGVTLTEVGKSVMERADRIMREASDLKADAGSRARYPSGEIVFATPPSIAKVFAPDVIETFRRDYPEVRLIMREETVDVIFDWLMREHVDVALLYDREAPSAVQAETLLTDSLHLIGPMQMEKPANVTAAIVATIPLVVTTAAYGWRRRLENSLQEHALKATIRAEVDSISVIKELVMRGFACSVLPRSAVADELRGRRLWALPIPALALGTRLMMMRLRHRAHTPANEALCELLRRRSAALLETP